MQKEQVHARAGDLPQLRRAVYSWEMARVENGHDVVCWRCLNSSGVR